MSTPANVAAGQPTGPRNLGPRNQPSQGARQHMPLAQAGDDEEE